MKATLYNSVGKQLPTYRLGFVPTLPRMVDRGGDADVEAYQHVEPQEDENLEPCRFYQNSQKERPRSLR